MEILRSVRRASQAGGKLRAVKPVPGLLALLLVGLAGNALSHGETTSDLSGVSLCVDARAAQVTLEELPAARAAGVQARLASGLRQSLLNALKDTQIPYDAPPSCQGRSGMTQIRAEVRYLDPQTYQGFGDPAYSYAVMVRVSGPPDPPQAQPKRGFSAGYSEIHSESRTGRPFEAVVGQWAGELSSDLAQVWQRGHPTLMGRVVQAWPVGLTAGIALLTAWIGYGWKRRRAGRPEPSQS